MNWEELQKYSPFYRAVHENRYIRREFLSRIQETFKVDLVLSYIEISSPIEEIDPIIFQDALYDIETKLNSLLLILHSNGGSPHVAEKLVEIIRDNAKKFYVVIPERAKSAATILSLGADRIFMLENSELGPIDPQIRIKDKWLPAHSIIDGVEKIIKKIGRSSDINPALALLLQDIDPAIIDFAEKAIEYSEKLATDLLSQYMIKGNYEKAQEIAHELCSPEKFLTHGQPITWKQAQKLGLKVIRLKKRSIKYDLIWRYFCYCLIHMTRDNKIKLLESPKNCIVLPLDT